jgi:hypothetical protein
MNNIVFLYFYKSSDKYCVNVVDIGKDKPPQIYTYDSETIERKLHELRKYAEEDAMCFNTLKAWQDIVNININYTVLVALHKKKYIIQGWCNLKYSKLTLNGGKANPLSAVYCLEIQKIVTRSAPKIKNLGTVMIQFIKEQCMNKIAYESNIINVDILYLYSLPTSIDFYNKFDDFKVFVDKEGNHTFYYVNNAARPSLFANKEVMESIEILWGFENTAHMSDEDIIKYKQNMNEFSDEQKKMCDTTKDEIVIYETEPKSEIVIDNVTVSKSKLGVTKTISKKLLGEKKQKLSVKDKNSKTVLSLKS